MGFPLVIIFACVLWTLMSIFKWWIMGRQSSKYQLNSKQLEELFTVHPNMEKAAESYEKRIKAEKETKLKESAGKTLIDLIEERRNNKDKPKISKYASEMFEDPLSRLNAEQYKLNKEALLQREKVTNRKKCNSSHMKL